MTNAIERVSAVRADDATAEPTSARARPRVGVISAWFDPEDERPWSGVPAGIVQELKRLGVYAGRRDATPWVPAARVVRHWMRLSRRAKGWTMRPEMRALGRVSDAVRRRVQMHDADGWIHFVGAFGRVVAGKYVTVFEMSPTQLLEHGARWAPSLGFPYGTPANLAWVARRHVAAYRGAHACCMASRWAADSLVRDHGIPAAKIHVIGYGRNIDFPAPRCTGLVPPALPVHRACLGSEERRRGRAIVPQTTVVRA